MQINYSGYYNTTGYSLAAQEYILAIRHVNPEANIRIQYFNTRTPIGMSPYRDNLFFEMSKKPLAPDAIHVFHCIPHRYRRPKGAKKCVGVCLFETMNPPKEWIRMMNEMDLIITASTFNELIFKAHGATVPIKVVPHCFDPKMFNKDVKHNGRYSLFTFMSIGTWKARKNWEGLIKGFYDAFSKKDDVCLLVKTDKPKELEACVRRIKQTSEWRSKETAPIFAEQKTHCLFEEIPAFMKKAQIYISTSLGEGFCLPNLHAMALDIPLVTTKFGGVLEYAKPDNCTYIEPKHYKTYPTMDGVPQFANCIWPVLRTHEIRDQMIEVRKHYPKDKAKQAYQFVHENFNYDVIGKKFLEAIGD